MTTPDSASGQTTTAHFLRAGLIVALFSMVSGCYNPAESQQALINSPTKTDGWVSGINCNNHGAVFYSFSANSREFTARAPSGSLDCRLVKHGEKIVVFYLASDPAVNTILDPKEAYARAKGWYIPGWAWFIFLVSWALALPIIGAHRIEKQASAREIEDA